MTFRHRMVRSYISGLNNSAFRKRHYADAFQQRQELRVLQEIGRYCPFHLHVLASGGGRMNPRSGRGMRFMRRIVRRVQELQVRNTVNVTYVTFRFERNERCHVSDMTYRTYVSYLILHVRRYAGMRQLVHLIELVFRTRSVPVLQYRNAVVRLRVRRHERNATEGDAFLNEPYRYAQ